MELGSECILTINICRAKCGWYIFIWQARSLHMNGGERVLAAEGKHPCTISGPPSYLCHPQKPSHVLSANFLPPIYSQEDILKQGNVSHLEDQCFIGTGFEMHGTAHQVKNNSLAKLRLDREKQNSRACHSFNPPKIKCRHRTTADGRK